jgi:hypothetical protein
MVYFQTKNTNLGKFWKVLQWKMLVYFMAILVFLRPTVVFHGHLYAFVDIWYIFPNLVFCAKKNLATLVKRKKQLDGRRRRVPRKKQSLKFRQGLLRKKTNNLWKNSQDTKK